MKMQVDKGNLFIVGLRVSSVAKQIDALFFMSDNIDYIVTGAKRKHLFTKNTEISVFLKYHLFTNK